MLVLMLGLVGSGLVGLGSAAGDALGAQGTVTASPGSGVAGATVAVTGAGFQARARVRVIWDGVDVGLPTVTTDRSGAFGTSIRIPDSAPGDHTVGVARATGRSQLLASVAFVVLAGGGALPPGASPTPGPLPPPGASPGPTPTAPAIGPTLAPIVSPTPGSPTTAPTTAPGGSAPTANPTAAPTATPAATPRPTATAAPTVAPTAAPTPTAAPAAKLTFGLGSQAESARVSALTTSSPIRILSSWYNGPHDIGWITDSYHRSIFQAAYADGFSLHLITWTPEPETRFSTPYGTTCGRAYPLSAAWLEDMRKLAEAFAGAASGPPLYVTLLTEFQTYPCVENAWSANAEATAYYQTLISQYEQAVAIFHEVAPNSRVSLGWGGWQASYDDPAIAGGRSLFPYFAGAMAKSDFMSFQAMHGMSNVQAIKDMTRVLGDYGPVMLAHHMPDGDTNPLSTVYRVFEEDVRALLTPTGVNGLAADGLFSWSFLDDKPLQASTTTFSLVRDAVRAFGR